MSLEQLIDDFDFIDDWEDRYRYLIELGKSLIPLRDEEYTDAHKVEGCASQVWLVCDYDAEAKIMNFRGDSDALIVKGLIAVALAIFSGKSPQEISDLDPRPVFEQLGLMEHLTKQRSNGLTSMVGRIKAMSNALVA